jgi:hypothetical protein
MPTSKGTSLSSNQELTCFSVTFNINSSYEFQHKNDLPTASATTWTMNGISDDVLNLDEALV